MKIIEYRILMPMNVEQNQIGQIWSFSEISRLNTGGGEGVEILKNELFPLPASVATDMPILKRHLPEYVDYETQKQLSNSNKTKNSPSSSSLFSIMSFRSKSNQTGNNTTTTNNNNNNNNTGSPHRSSSLRKTSGEASGMTHSKSMDIRSVNAIKPSQAPLATDDTAAPLSTGGAPIDTSHVTVSMSNIPTFDLPREDTPPVLNETASPPTPTTTRAAMTPAAGVKYGQYTHKIYKMTSKLPWFVRKILPKATTEIEEKSWNVYPVVKTVLTNEFFINCSRIELDTITRECPNGKCEENVHQLTPEQLEQREVVYIDIAEPVPPGYYKPEEDPALCRSEKAGIGPLAKGWQEKQRPLVCCYKLVFAEFKVFGLQSRAESYLRNMYKDLFAVFHRQIFCWMDKWYDLSLEEVRELERKLAAELKEQINKGELSKTVLQQE